MKYWFIICVLIPSWTCAEVTWKADIPPPFSTQITLNALHLAIDEQLQFEAEFHYPSVYRLDTQAMIDRLTWSANPLEPFFRIDAFTISHLAAEKGMLAQRLLVTLTPLIEGAIELSVFTVAFLSDQENNPPIFLPTPLFSLEITGAKSLSINQTHASLMPLEPEFPLGLSEANRRLFLENPVKLEEEKERIRRALEKKAFPWMTLLMLIGMGWIGWIAYLMKARFLLHRALRSFPSPWEQAAAAFDNLTQKASSNPSFGLFSYLNRLFRKSIKISIFPSKPDSPKNLIVTGAYYDRLSVILYTALKTQWKQDREMTSTEIA